MVPFHISIAHIACAVPGRTQVGALEGEKEGARCYHIRSASWDRSENNHILIRWKKESNQRDDLFPGYCFTLGYANWLQHHVLCATLKTSQLKLSSQHDFRHSIILLVFIMG